MMEKYTVSNPRGVSERTVTHPWRGYSGHYDDGEELTVYQTYSSVGPMYRSYVWGRITEKPDQYGRHKYVCITLDNNTFCTKNDIQPDPGPVGTWQQRIDAWARSKGFIG